MAARSLAMSISFVSVVGAGLALRAPAHTGWAGPATSAAEGGGFAGLDEGLEARGGLELRRPVGGDLHRLAGPQVAAGAGRALGCLEGAEAEDGHVVACRDGHGDDVEQAVEDLGDGLLVQADVLGDGG